MSGASRPKDLSAKPSPTLVAERLELLRSSVGADAILLIDRSGSLVATAGVRTELDPVVLGSLAPTHLEATNDLASLVGGIEFRALVQQGGAATILLASGAAGVVAAVHSGALPAETFTAKTEAIVTELEGMMKRGALEDGVRSPVSQGWRHDATRQVDRVFREGA